MMTTFQPARMKDLLTHLPSHPDDELNTAFLLGGIGTGNVSVTAGGAFIDWELFNKPGKGNRFPFQFFCLHTCMEGQRDTRILEAPMRSHFTMCNGSYSFHAGLPRMQKAEMRAEYPLCMVEFAHEKVPVDVTMESYTPFIPLNSNDSGIPGAIIRFRIRNRQDVPVYASVAAAMPNITCPGNLDKNGILFPVGQTRNEMRSAAGISGIFMTSEGYCDTHPLKGSFALCTTNSEHTGRASMYKGNRRDCIREFWNDFSQTGAIHQNTYDHMKAGHAALPSTLDVAVLAPSKTLAPGEETVFEFILTWYIPNRVYSWHQAFNPRSTEPIKTVRNYYATLFSDAWNAAEYLASEMPRLERDTLAFHKALFESTYPTYVLDALSANITALRSPTCFRLEDGTFLAWEGCLDQVGSCYGSCTHVWNYAQTVAWLFPDLEVSGRYNEFTLETEDDGKMNFRATKRLKNSPWLLPSAVDGQNGTIVRLLREWKITGDNRIIDDLGENVLKSMDYCIRTWDPDHDGVVSGEQHNTYDIEFQGFNSLGNSMYLAALCAAAEVADYLNRPDTAAFYRDLAEKGCRNMDELLWNGEYYIQKASPEEMEQYKYQYGEGCLADQLIGQYMAHAAGLGHILPPEHVKEALASIYRHNFRIGMQEYENIYRVYAANDEAGLLLCTWPRGGQPFFPFYFSCEVWTGVEYQVAANMIWDGLVDEGLQLVKAVRERYNGKTRNPFDEIECGHHYARSMASWAILLALSGCHVDLRKGEISFQPQINADHFQTFYSTGKEWGVYSQHIDENGQLHTSRTALYTIG